MRAKKHLGQNFLRDEKIIRRIVASLDIDKLDTVFEIGPGRGALTDGLLRNAGRVIAVEFDRDMVAILKVAFALRTNLQILNEDALSVDFSSLVQNSIQSSPVKLVANLPYNISTPILQRLLEQRNVFSTIVLMFQREVVNRIAAIPGGKDRGYLSVLVENAFTVERLFDVPPQAFTPVPKVWSSVVRLTPKRPVIEDESLLRSIVSTSFAMRRKTLANNLVSRFPDFADLLFNAEIDGSRRAQTLSIDEWARIVDTSKRKAAGEHR